MKYTEEQLRMQMLAGIISESQFKAKLNEEDEGEDGPIYKGVFVPYQFDDIRSKELYLKYNKSFEDPSWTRGDFPNSKEIELQTLLDITGMTLEELEELNRYGDEGWKLNIDNNKVTEFVD